ncbi:MAG: hypothetical protein QNJ68_21050 [Microcoleaceae cyanobacterium MO_207.B10]|nr:hypothetical protein [Microcoleaceae cyanobacterium MO_207.B10]
MSITPSRKSSHQLPTPQKKIRKKQVKMIVQNFPELMTLAELSEWYPDSYGRYELRNGVIFEMQPTGTH